MNEKRGPWYLLTGLVIGVVLGLLYAWVIQPVQPTNTPPNSLRADFKDQYRTMIAVAYLANGDLVRARARLELLQDPDLYRALTEQAQRKLAEGAYPEEARALGLLAVAMGQASAPPAQTPATQVTAAADTPTSQAAPFASPTTPVVTSSPSPTRETTVASPPAVTTPQATAGTPSVTRTVRASATPPPTGTALPTRTATPTQGAPFVLDTQELVCNPNLEQALIQVEVFDSANQPVPGVEVVVNWDGGENHFFTGFKPEISLGYTDFAMTPGVVYTLRLADGGQIIPGLTPTECESPSGDRYWGAWKLVFVQP
jgi:hypothetical protein